MVGSTVDRFNCDALDTSVTVPPDYNYNSSSTIAYGDVTSSGGTQADVVQCKVAVAAAVTFLGGVLQVRANGFIR